MTEPKRVSFDPNVKVYPLYKWDYAYREARKSQWEQFTRDRIRFQRRFQAIEELLSPIFAEKLKNYNQMKNKYDNNNK